MSKSVSKSVACPHCGKSAAAKMWTVVNVSKNPELREKIFDESLFDWKCPHCDGQAQLVSRCLYHDFDRKFMVYLIPDFSLPVLDDGDLEQQFPEVASVRKRVVSDVNQLKEKILIFEDNANDMAVELAKLAVTNLVEKKHKKTVVSSYFCKLDKDSNQISLSFYLEGENQPVLFDTRADVYTKSLEIVDGYAKSEQNSSKFLSIGSKWAANILERYYAEE